MMCATNSVVWCASLPLKRWPAPADDPRLKSIEQWLPAQGAGTQHVARGGDELATIVYTSGTTGRPKGVMLSHHNILSNAFAGLQKLTVSNTDSLLSFLPLSHTFERTCGYYLTIMCGATVAYSRGIPQLADDLQSHPSDDADFSAAHL